MSTTRPSHPHFSGLITAMFTDIVGSTELKGAMPADTARGRDAQYRSSVKEPHDSMVLEHICGGGGHRVKSTGDGFLFTFGDVDDAVLCALAVQDCLKAQPIQTPIGPLRIRIGIHTGPADPSDVEFTAATVDKAARVQAQAGPGEVLVSKETHALIQLKNVGFDAIDADLRGLGTDTLYRASRSRSVEPHGAHQPETALADLENPYDFATTANQRTFKGRRPSWSNCSTRFRPRRTRPFSGSNERERRR
jgi:class 3 adenylate cyclase